MRRSGHRQFLFYFILFSDFIEILFSQRQMITQTVNLLVGYQVGNLQENSTRSLC